MRPLLRSTWWLAGLPVLLAAGCANPLYWFVQPQKLYVSVSTTHALYVLDRAGLRSTWEQVWLQDTPDRMAYVPSRKELLVLEPAAKAVAIVSPNSNSVVASVGTAGAGTDLGVSSDGRYAYVADSTDDTVVCIDLQTDAIHKTFSYAGESFQPVAVAGSPANPSDAFVVSSTGRVSVIHGDVQDYTTFNLPGAVKPARIVAGTHRDLYVTDGGAPSLFHIANPNSPAATQIPLEGAQGSPYGAAIGPDGTVYVSFPQGGQLLTIAPGGQETPFDVGGSSPRAIAADSQGVYIANEGSNDVVAMTLQGTTLLAPRVMDTLPGPPVDLLAI
ncbi:MAG: hypothetical protein KGR26_02220 [Cyanobacteria bacterium REEB65]|nr:hypothetical protein [Cyanobacteria bacterium REEB65]